MAKEAQPVQPVQQGVTNNTITGRVYITGQLSSTAEDKAAELTILVDSLTKWGIFRNIADAVKQKVPTGTFVLVDASGEDLSDVKVMVVPFYRRGDRPKPEEPAKA
jgi:hypothetical protein